MTETTIAEIEREIREVDQLFRSFNELLTRVKDKDPDLVEMTALSTVIHSFYNGLENIFSRIAKGIDDLVPAGVDSHRALLRQMSEPQSSRNAVLRRETAEDLAEYLAFRHFYRHGYAHHLDWERLGQLLRPLPAIWQRVRGELRSFLGELS